MSPTLLEIGSVVFAAFVFIRIGYPVFQDLYKPDRWHLFPVCLLIGHRWSESYRPEGDGYQPQLKTCERCGIDHRANPPAPLVP